MGATPAGLGLRFRQSVRLTGRGWRCPVDLVRCASGGGGLQGGDLYTALRSHPETMRWERLGKKVMLDIALGMNYLHTRRPPMMHRDLKVPPAPPRPRRSPLPHDTRSWVIG